MTRRGLRARVEGWTEPKVPLRLRERWLPLHGSGREQLAEVLSTAGYRIDGVPTVASLADHLEGRLAAFRKSVVPWLADALPLDGAKILEIGCGTGSSTVALAEQGAKVIGVDILADRVEISRARCAAYGVTAELHVANAADVASAFADYDVDAVIFFAALEHMTLDERLTAMDGTWRMLRSGALWSVIDTPNRLWVYDGHTTHLPFFHWLPDDLAVRYIRKSPRTELADLGQEVTPASIDELARHGRGVSYHEFEIAMASIQDLDIVASLTDYQNRCSPARRILSQASPARRIERTLRRAGPTIHRSFYEEGLNIVIRKS